MRLRQVRYQAALRPDIYFLFDSNHLPSRVRLSLKRSCWFWDARESRLSPSRHRPKGE